MQLSSFIIISDYNNIEYISGIIKSFKSLIFIIDLLFLSPFENIFQTMNIK